MHFGSPCLGWVICSTSDVTVPCTCTRSWFGEPAFSQLLLCLVTAGEAKPRSAEVADSGIAWHSLGTPAWSPDSSGTGILYPVTNALLSVLTPACVSHWLVLQQLFIAFDAVLPRGRASRGDACVSDGGARHGGGCLRGRAGDRLLTGRLLCCFGCREAFSP